MTIFLSTCPSSNFGVLRFGSRLSFHLHVKESTYLVGPLESILTLCPKTKEFLSQSKERKSLQEVTDQSHRAIELNL